MRFFKLLAIVLLTVITLGQGAFAKDYKYFSIQIPQNWVEAQAEMQRQQGINHVSFRRQDGKAGLDIFSSPFPGLGTNPRPFQTKVALTLVLASIEQRAKIKFWDKRFDEETQTMEVKTKIKEHTVDGRLFYRNGYMFGVASSGLTKGETLQFLETFKAKTN